MKYFFRSTKVNSLTLQNTLKNLNPLKAAEACQMFLPSRKKNIDCSTNLKKADLSFHRSWLSPNCHQNIANSKESTALHSIHFGPPSCSSSLRMPSAVLKWLTDSILGWSLQIEKEQDQRRLPPPGTDEPFAAYFVAYAKLKSK